MQQPLVIPAGVSIVGTLFLTHTYNWAPLQFIHIPKGPVEIRLPHFAIIVNIVSAKFFPIGLFNNLCIIR